MKREFRYFRIAGGAVLAKHEEFIVKRTAQLEARDQLLEKYGADGSYGSRRGLVALHFPSDAPAGWRPIKEERGYFKPPLGKAGKAIRAELDAIRVIDAHDYHVLIAGGIGFVDSAPGHGFALRYMIFERIGDTLILVVPACKDGDAWQPEDDQCVPLKHSEYWQIKEAAGMAAEVPA